MADWNEITYERHEAERLSGLAREAVRHDDALGICHALESIRIELRALAMVLDRAMAARA